MTDSAATEDEDAAVRWAIRLDGEPLSDTEQATLDAWLEEHPSRRGALLRAEATLAYLDRGRALAEPEMPAAAPRRFGRRMVLVGGSLGGLAAASVLGFLMLPHTRGVEIQTAIGEVRRTPLADGSMASINTDSRIAVAMRPEQRDVTLEEGEAWFQVAHDKARPFVVKAGNVRVRAVGTAFSVRRRAGGADVLVTEGVVEVWTAGHAETTTRIAAGSKSFVKAESPNVTVLPAAADIDRQLAWRTGEIALNGESLAYAVGEFNRYNRRKIVIRDARLGRAPLVGYFRADQPEAFGRAAAKLLGAHMRTDEDTITLAL